MNENYQIDHMTSSQSDPILLLKDEHYLMLRRLETLERTLQYLESLPWNVASAQSEKEQRHLREGVSELEADLSHHFEKEEKALFPVLSEYIGQEQGPIGVVLNEHETLRSVYRGWKKMVFDLCEQAGAQREVILRGVSASGYEAIHLLRTHISKENQIIFEICEAVLSSKEKKQVAEMIKAM